LELPNREVVFRRFLTRLSRKPIRIRRENVLMPVLRIRNLQGPPPRSNNPVDHHYYNLRQEMRRLFRTMKIAA
jgi:hypothetical protein